MNPTLYETFLFLELQLDVNKHECPKFIRCLVTIDPPVRINIIKSTVLSFQKNEKPP